MLNTFEWPVRRHRWLMVLVSLVVLGIGVTACGGGGSSTATSETGGGSETTQEGGQSSEGPGELSVDFANITDAAPLFKLLKEGVESAANKVGYQLRTYDNNFDPETTLRNAQLMVQDEPEVILSYNGVEGVAKSIETLYERANIPCVAVNTPGAGGCSWFNLYNPQVCGDTGKVVGKKAAEEGWTGENTTVILVQAATAGAEINTGLGYFYESLQEEIPGLAQIKSYKEITPSTTKIGDTTIQVDGEGLLESTFTAVSNALQSIPADRNLIVYAVNDDSALGAWRAVSRSGRASHAITAGLGGGEAGLEQLRKNPHWVAEGDVFFYYWGEYLMAMARAVANGATIPSLTTAPIAVLTKDETIADTIVHPIDRYYHEGQTKAYRLPPLQPVSEQQTDLLGKVPVGNEYLAETGVLQEFGNVEGLE